MFIALNSRCGERSSGAPCKLQKPTCRSERSEHVLCVTFVYKHAAPPELRTVESSMSLPLKHIGHMLTHRDTELEKHYLQLPQSLLRW